MAARAAGEGHADGRSGNHLDRGTNAAATAVDEAMLMLQEAAPEAAQILIGLLTKLKSAKVLCLVAYSILDRASKKTAVKQDQIELPGLEVALTIIFGDEDE